MRIRELRISDAFDIEKLHAEYFPNNEKPNFFSTEYRSPFAVADDDDRIIVAGGIRLIPEVMVLTDKSLPVAVRYEALLQACGASISIAKDMNYKELYAFIFNDDRYVGVLQKHGFRLLKEKLLVLDIGEQNG